MTSSPREPHLDDDNVDSIEGDDDLIGGTDTEDLDEDEAEGDLDDALEDTFPASDPLPPPSRPGT